MTRGDRRERAAPSPAGHLATRCLAGGLGRAGSFNFGQGLALALPARPAVRHTGGMERRALILHHLTGPVTVDEQDTMSEETVERLYGLSTAYPEYERHDVRVVADALREFDQH